MTIIQKRRVTMRAAVTTFTAEGVATTQVHEAVDYVPANQVDQYTADARTRWQSVTVGNEHDAGPGGDTHTEE